MINNEQQLKASIEYKELIDCAIQKPKLDGDLFYDLNLQKLKRDLKKVNAEIEEYMQCS